VLATALWVFVRLMGLAMVASGSFPEFLDGQAETSEV
jgi:hypothetical protein